MLEGCSQSEFNTLVTIEQIEAEKVNVNKIAESLKVSMPAVSKTLKNLESKKLIKRKIDVFCRRNTKIKITELGKSELAENNDRLNKIFDTYFLQLPNEEQEMLINSIEKMYKVFNEKLKEWGL
jgi:DNA-binding MarR family transcriptional regulator